MVKISRTPNGADRLRSLSTPRPVSVRTGSDDLPAGVRVRGHWIAVTQVLSHWRLDDEWWRDAPQVRWYYRLLLVNARTLTLYHDRIAGSWYTQPYGRVGQ